MHGNFFRWDINPFIHLPEEYCWTVLDLSYNSTTLLMKIAVAAAESD